MSEINLLEQAEELFQPGQLDLTYRYGHDICCADIVFSDGVEWWYFQVSNLMGDALQQLISVLVSMLRYDESEGWARWWHEPAESRWVLRRDRDSLRITVLALPDFHMPLPDSAGRIRLQTTVDFWTFAQRVRLAASRVGTMPVGEQQRHVSFEQDPEYQALCRYLAEHRARR